MFERPDHLLLGAGTGCLLLAVAFYCVAVGISRRAALRRVGAPGPLPKDASDVFMAIASALVAGAVIAVGIFVLEQRVIEQRDRETRLLMTADLSGYDPGPTAAARGQLTNPTSDRCVESVATIEGRKDLEGRYLAAKRVRGARLSGLNLSGTQFRDSDLTGADFRCSILRGANLRHANLADADLRGADLSGADLRGASLARATLPGSDAWKGAKVNAQTCWPGKGDWRKFAGWGLRPWVMAGSRSYPVAFGHLCGSDQVLRDGAAPGGVEVSRAPGEHSVATNSASTGDSPGVRGLACGQIVVRTMRHPAETWKVYRDGGDCNDGPAVIAQDATASYLFAHDGKCQGALCANRPSPPGFTCGSATAGQEIETGLIETCGADGATYRAYEDRGYARG